MIERAMITFSLILIMAINCYRIEATDELKDNAASASQNMTFTNEQIKENIQKYLNVVLGEKEPTVQDYLNFEGSGSERELVFELHECQCRGWGPYSSECIQFTRARRENAARERSYYYRYLRSLLSKQKGELIIHEISLPDGARYGVGQFLIEASLGKTQLEFYHAANASVVPAGLVGILKINNEPIFDILDRREKSCE